MRRSLLTIAITALSALALASTAYAGCNPACPKGQQCRYEAAGGKFYCEPLKSGKVAPKAPTGAAPGGAAPSAPATTTTTGR